MLSSLLLHVPPLSPLLLKFVADPILVLFVPLMVPAFGAATSVTTQVPDDAVKLVLHVPSFASLVYVPADEGAYVAEFELANTLEPFFH